MNVHVNVLNCSYACFRSYRNLIAHIQQKHPDWEKDDGDEVQVELLAHNQRPTFAEVKKTAFFEIRYSEYAFWCNKRMNCLTIIFNYKILFMLILI